MFIKGAPDYLIKKSSKIMTKSGNVVNLDAESKVP